MINVIDIHHLTKQISYLYSQNRIDEARDILSNLPTHINFDHSYVRELLADTYIMADDVMYFYEWYKQNLLKRKATDGDQILIYALCCYNKIMEARLLFHEILPTLSNAQHFTYALKHIPKLIEDYDQRIIYYHVILEKSQAALLANKEPKLNSDWYEVLLRVHYCLGNIKEFEKTTLIINLIQSETSQKHLDFLERLQNKSSPKQKVKKIFGIGLSKTGTSSLSKALLELGFSTAHWTNSYSYDLLSKKDIPLFDSLTDVSISYNYREIYKEYPKAKYILTTRSVDRWEKSFLTHYARSTHASDFESLKCILGTQRPSRFGQRYIDIHEELYFQYSNLPQAYQAHEQGVIDFFRGKEDQLLLLDVSEPDAFQKLANFLEVNCQQSAFPHENTKEEKNGWISPISGERRKFNFKT